MCYGFPVKGYDSGQPGADPNLDNEDEMLLALDSPAERLRAYEVLHGDWRVHLTVGERDLISFLIHHTSANGEPLRATLTQIVEGKAGKLGPLGQSLATLKRLVSALVEKGVLTLCRVGVAVEWCINFAWRRGDMVAVPRRMRDPEGQGRLNMSRGDHDEPVSVSRRAQSEPPIVSRLSSSSSSEEGSEETNQRAEVRHRSRPAPQAQPAQAAPVSGGPIRRVITSILARKPAAPAPAAKHIQPTGHAMTLDTAWRDGWKSLMPDSPVPPIPRIERDILAGLKKRLDKNRSLNSLDFITWAVANWRQVCADKFAWMTRQPPPAVPAIRFLAKENCLRLFLEAYAEQRDRDAVAKMSDRDEAEIRRRMATGLTRQKAILEIATERASAKTRAESEAERDAVRRAYDALQAERAALRPGIAPAKAHHRPLHERVDPGAWDGIEVDPEQIVDLSRMGLKAME